MKKKIQILAKIAKNEAKFPEIDMLENLMGNFSEKNRGNKHQQYFPERLIEDSRLFQQSLQDLQENYVEDHLSAGQNIPRQILSQRDIYEPLPQVDALEASGMHIVDVQDNYSDKP